MAKSAEINVVNLPVVKQMLADRDRVIARLLDGWEPYWNGQMWSRLDLDIGDVVKDGMSDGEAAIIRRHQEGST